MKRIANKVAVQTVMYAMRGDALVTIVDYKNLFDLSNRINGEVVFDDECSVINSYEYAKISASEIHEIYARQSGVIEISICTSHDNY